MLKFFVQWLSPFGHRIQALEQSLFRKEIVFPFLVLRLALMAAMLIGFYLAFPGHS